MGDDQRREFYYNLETHEIEEGKVSSWSNRMGPYKTREQAQHALEIAAARNEKWDEDDRR